MPDIIPGIPLLSALKPLPQSPFATIKLSGESSPGLSGSSMDAQMMIKKTQSSYPSPAKRRSIITWVATWLRLAAGWGVASSQAGDALGGSGSPAGCVEELTVKDWGGGVLQRVVTGGNRSAVGKESRMRWAAEERANSRRERAVLLRSQKKQGGSRHLKCVKSSQVKSNCNLPPSLSGCFFAEICFFCVLVATTRPFSNTRQILWPIPHQHRALDFSVATARRIIPTRSP